MKRNGASVRGGLADGVPIYQVFLAALAGAFAVSLVLPTEMKAYQMAILALVVAGGSLAVGRRRSVPK